jgi:hypothetical protein
LNEAETEAG